MRGGCYLALPQVTGEHIFSQTEKDIKMVKKINFNQRTVVSCHFMACTTTTATVKRQAKENLFLINSIKSVHTAACINKGNTLILDHQT